MERNDGAPVRACSVCQLDNVLDLETAYIRGTSLTDLALTFGVGRDAVRRHVKRHLHQRIALAGEAAEVAAGDALLAEVRILKSDAEGIRRRALAAGNLRAAVAAQREVRGSLILLAQVKDALPVAGGLTINLFGSAEFQTIAAQILHALRAYPDARAEVAGVLHSNVLAAVPDASSDRPTA
jgi:predicted Zn-dependent protease